MSGNGRSLRGNGGGDRFLRQWFSSYGRGMAGSRSNTRSQDGLMIIADEIYATGLRT